MTDAAEKHLAGLPLSIPVVIISIGVVLIGTSFLPVGKFLARLQWTSEDSAKYDRVSRELKQSNYQSPTENGVSPEEWQAQREKMKQQMSALQSRLENAKSQPQLWSRYLLGVGVLLTIVGFYVNAANRG